MIRSILSSAAEAFAGVFGFLSPLMGPLAAGPAAAAQATVAGMAGSVASADIGMWQVPEDLLTLVHQGSGILAHVLQVADLPVELGNLPRKLVDLSHALHHAQVEVALLLGQGIGRGIEAGGQIVGGRNHALAQREIGRVGG